MLYTLVSICTQSCVYSCFVVNKIGEKNEKTILVNAVFVLTKLLFKHTPFLNIELSLQHLLKTGQDSAQAKSG